jgi:hypothetical protein
MLMLMTRRAPPCLVRLAPQVVVFVRLDLAYGEDPIRKKLADGDGGRAGLLAGGARRGADRSSPGRLLLLGGRLLLGRLLLLLGRRVCVRVAATL